MEFRWRMLVGTVATIVGVAVLIASEDYHMTWMAYLGTMVVVLAAAFTVTTWWKGTTWRKQA